MQSRHFYEADAEHPRDRGEAEAVKALVEARQEDRGRDLETEARQT